MCVVYGLNFLDKTTLSYASIMGLEEDLGLTGDNYQWLGSMFYFGYLGWEYPTNRLLQRLPIGKYSAGCVIAWGTVLSCFAAVQTFGGAVAIRFFLGVCESAVTPGFALITSQWYTKREQGKKIRVEGIPLLQVSRVDLRDVLTRSPSIFRNAHWHLVLVQWLGADPWRFGSIWYC